MSHAVMFAWPLRGPLRRPLRKPPASVSHGLDRAKPSNANEDLQQRNESCFDFLLSDESLMARLFPTRSHSFMYN